MASNNKPFALIERDGYKERTVADADSLEELADKLAEKTGGDDFWGGG